MIGNERWRQIQEEGDKILGKIPNEKEEPKGNRTVHILAFLAVLAIFIMGAILFYRKVFLGIDDGIFL
jgi:hypothetical protein